MGDQLLDLVLTVLHLGIILINLFGWIPERTRRLHLWVAGTTVGCWLVLGIWFGIGYCPITDWQWAVKERMGDRDLPASFITYLLNTKFGFSVPVVLIDFATAFFFAIAIALSVWVNSKPRKSH